MSLFDIYKARKLNTGIKIEDVLGEIYGIVDLGTLNYEWYNTQQGVIYRCSAVSDAINTYDSLNFICSKYTTVKSSGRKDKTISSPMATRFDIIDSSYSDLQEFKKAMSGVYLVYEKGAK